MKELYRDIINKNSKIAIIGLGYVGLPQALAFSKRVKTIGYDISESKIKEYSKYENEYLELTNKEEKLKEAKFIIVAVQTPINSLKQPDLGSLESASRTIAKNMERGTVVVYESTVYPGVTEDVCIPILEKESGLKLGKDFKVGYSPERINPGDEINKLDNIVKIVSSTDDETSDLIASIYEIIVDETYKVSSIKIAEAAKLAENIQRDINIAFMNELSMIFDRMNIYSKEVIKAMDTKWNSLGFRPGLVGGHCISIDPYYMIYKAEKLGYSSQIISLSREINDYMPRFIVDKIIKMMLQLDKDIKKSKFYVMGVTFKADYHDIRNSRAIEIIQLLKEYGIEALGVDPKVNKERVEELEGIKMADIGDVREADTLIFAVDHKEFRELDLSQINKMYKNIADKEKLLIDIKSIFSKGDVEKLGLSYYSL